MALTVSLACTNTKFSNKQVQLAQLELAIATSADILNLASMGDVVMDSMITETDIWLCIINGNPLLFYGVVVTGGVVIVLILYLFLVCLSLAY